MRTGGGQVGAPRNSGRRRRGPARVGTQTNRGNGGGGFGVIQVVLGAVGWGGVEGQRRGDVPCANASGEAWRGWGRAATYLRQSCCGQRRGGDAFGNDAGGDRHGMDAQCVLLQVASRTTRNGDFKLYFYLFLDRDRIDS